MPKIHAQFVEEIEVDPKQERFRQTSDIIDIETNDEWVASTVDEIIKKSVYPDLILYLICNYKNLKDIYIADFDGYVKIYKEVKK